MKLQAAIRGELVRRKVIPKIKTVCNHSLYTYICVCLCVCIVSSASNLLLCNLVFLQQLLDRNKRRDFLGSVSKEEMEALWFKKQEAVVKRDRMKKYSYSHRVRAKKSKKESIFVFVDT